MAIKFKTRGWSDKWEDRSISNRENLRIKEAQKKSTLKIPLTTRTGLDFQLDRTIQFPRKRSKFVRLPGSRERVEVFLQRDGTWKPERELASFRVPNKPELVDENTVVPPTGIPSESVESNSDLPTKVQTPADTVPTDQIPEDDSPVKILKEIVTTPNKEKVANALKIKQLERKGMSLQRGVLGRKWRNELKARKAKTIKG